MTRRLLAEERALWNRVIETVKPLHPVQLVRHAQPAPPPAGEVTRTKRLADGQAQPKAAVGRIAARHHAAPAPSTHLGEPKRGLDSHWERRFQKGAIIPDIRIDLHETSLAGAHARLEHVLEQAIRQRLRVILLITGKPRGYDRVSGEGRGAIGATVRDWLAASRFSRSIAAVRQAHPRHGGEGALYIVLRRQPASSRSVTRR